MTRDMSDIKLDTDDAGKAANVVGNCERHCQMEDEIRPEMNFRMPPTDYIINRMQSSGWVLMTAFVDRLGFYNLTFHRWDNGHAFSIRSAESWRDAVCESYAKWQKETLLK